MEPSSCVPTWWQGQASSVGSFIKGHSSHWWSLCPHDLIISQRPHLLILWILEFPQMNFWEDVSLQTIAHSLWSSIPYPKTSKLQEGSWSSPESQKTQASLGLYGVSSVMLWQNITQSVFIYDNPTWEDVRPALKKAHWLWWKADLGINPVIRSW